MSVLPLSEMPTSVLVPYEIRSAL